MQVGGLAYVIENNSDAVRANVWVGTQCGTVYTLDLPVAELRSPRQAGLLSSHGLLRLCRRYAQLSHLPVQDFFSRMAYSNGVGPGLTSY